MSNPQTAMVRADQTQTQTLSTLAYEPNSFDDLIKRSQLLARSQLVPTALRGKPEDVAIIAMKGKELGLTLMQSLGGIDVIQGRAQVNAQTLMSLVLQARDDGKTVCEYAMMVKSTATECVYETKRRSHPKPITISYTIAEAQAAGLTGKDNWKKSPADMLASRALSRLARRVYPDVIGGAYVGDELGEVEREEPRREGVLPQKAVARVVTDKPAPAAAPTEPVQDAEFTQPDPAPTEPPPHDNNGEVTPEGEPDYSKMTLEQKNAYWAAQLAKCPDKDAVKLTAKAMKGVEPEGSEVFIAFGEPYKAAWDRCVSAEKSRAAADKAAKDADAEAALKNS